MAETTTSNLPVHLEAPLAKVAQELQTALGDDLVSLIVFGGAARDEHVRRRSDVNLLIVLRQTGCEHLRKAAPVVHPHRRRIGLSPVVLSREDLAAYRDTFAIEYLEMQEQHLVLFGEDPLADLTVDPDHLRAQVQHELRAKLVRLRQAYLHGGGEPRAVTQLMLGSIGSFLTLFAVLLRLRGAQPARRRTELAGQVAEALGLDSELLGRLLAARAGEQRIRKDEAPDLFARYLTMIEAVVRSLQLAEDK